MRGLRQQATDALMGVWIFAQGLAGRFKIEKVSFRRDVGTAMTNGKEVILPTFAIPTGNSDEDLAVLEKLRDLMYGLIVHEVGHVMFTCFQTRRPEGIGRSIYQSIEDARQEVLIVREYPGAKQLLDAMCQRIISDGWHQVSAEMPAGNLVSMTVNAWMRSKIRGQSIYADMAKQGMQLVGDTLGQGVATRLHAILVMKADALQTTLESVEMAEEIVTMLNEEQEAAEQRAKQAAEKAESSDDDQDDDADADDASGSQGNDDGQDDDADDQNASGSQGSDDGQDDAADDQGSSGSQGSDDGQDDDADDQNASGSQGSDDGQDDAGDNQGPSGGQGAGSQDQPGGQSDAAIATAISAALANDTGVDDIGDIARAGIEAASDDVRQERDAVEVCDLPDISSTSANRSDGQFLMLGGEPVDQARVARATSQLLAKLKVELQTLTMAKTSVSERGNQVSMRHVSRLNSGDVRVFRHAKQTRKLDAAVMLLCDISGSMSGSKLRVAADALYAAACAIAPIPGVTVSARIFPGRGRVLGFNESPMMMRHRFALQATGSTPLTEGLMDAVADLVQRQEQRKAIFVLTDGDPNNRPESKLLIEQISRSGIELYGIGIQSNAVHGLFPEYGVINDLDQLSPVLIGLLKKKLISHLAA